MTRVTLWQRPGAAPDTDADRWHPDNVGRTPVRLSWQGPLAPSATGESHRTLHVTQ
ncbi:hypothetical protein GCM10022223_67960 [Kineosporia mesophila]|uniref:Uncharacterized protein n=1 Tax=Kineosporia mesophila TaxID=566012 RepID=A0ABP7AS32_9ACTN